MNVSEPAVNIDQNMRAAKMILILLMALLSPSLVITARPNVVIIIGDDVGIGDIGCFGNDTIRTPNIDNIARQGAKLTHHIAAASLCTPSRAAFLTARYPIRLGMVPTNLLRVLLFLSSVGGIPESEVTVAETFREHGYATGFIGKWHLGLSCNRPGDFCHHPLKQGFDYYYGVPLTNVRDFGDKETDTVFLARVPRLREIFWAIVVVSYVTLFILRRWFKLSKILFYVIFFVGTFVAVAAYFNIWYFKRFNSLIMRGFDVVEQPIRFEHLTQRLVNEGVEFMEKNVKEEKPFFLIMSWVQAHTVLYNSVPGFRGRSAHGRYGDNLEEMDWSVGEVTKAIERLGLKGDTFVYFSSDNGGHLEEADEEGNREGGHNGIYRGGKAQGGMEGGIRVPTVAMWPGHIPEGSVLDSPTSQMDIFPTLAQVIGAKMPNDRAIDGRDILPALRQQRDPDERFLVHYCGKYIHSARLYVPEENKVWKAWFATPDFLPGEEKCEFVVCDCYGSGVTWHDPPLLYELTSDPSERNPLDPKLPQHRKTIELIQNKVETHKKSVLPVTNQFSFNRLLPVPWMQQCCNFPSCECTDTKYQHEVDPNMKPLE